MVEALLETPRVDEAPIGDGPVRDSVSVEEAAPERAAPSREFPLDPRVAVMQSEAADPHAKDDAFAAIVQEFQGPLRGYVAGMVESWDEAEDLVQVTLMRAFNAMDRFQPTGTLASWLYTIAANTARNAIRDRNRRGEIGRAAVAEGVAPRTPANAASQIGNPEAHVEFLEELSVLDEINERQRAAMLVQGLGGYSYEEIARILGTTVPAVKSLLVRGRGKSARLIREMETFELPEEVREAA